MNQLNIFLEEDGSIMHFTPDFKITKGSYGNNLINIMVPHTLLVDPVTDKDTESNITGNVITIGAVVRTSMGKNLVTKKYKMKKIKTFSHNATEYTQYQRIMPKPFTLWVTTTNEDIASAAGLDMIINVVNWTKNSVGAKIEEIAASPVLRLDIYPSEHLEEEDIEAPSDMDLLHSQVQEIESKVNSMNFDLYGTEEDNLGEYLSKRLKAGRKIKITKDTSKSPNNQIEISAEEIRANEVPIDPIQDMKAEDVQGALEELNKRTDSQSVDTLEGIEEGMVDNTDPRNPIICHDNSKVDKKAIVDNLETEDAKKVLSANQGVIIKKLLEELMKNLLDETDAREESDETLQGQIETLETNKADKNAVAKEISNAISAVINSAPEAFDTLKEIADWIAQDEVGTTALISRVASIETKNQEQDTKIALEENERKAKDNELQEEVDKTLRFTEQELTEAQKDQARRNIGVDKSGSTVDYAIVTNKPELDTTNEESLEPVVEVIDNIIKLHKVSKTGKWENLVGINEKFSQYLPLSGGTITGMLNAFGGISVNSTTPRNNNLIYMLGIKPFAEGGDVNYIQNDDMIVGKAKSDGNGNNIVNTYLKKAGDKELDLWGLTSDYRGWDSNNPKILFGNAENGQKVAFIYNDFDSQRAPAGITLAGEQGNEYFEAPKLYEGGQRVYSQNNQQPIVDTAKKLEGFQIPTYDQSWGNQIGTFIHGENDSTGGSLAFRRDNPNAGQLSMIIDGRFYQNEGQYAVVDESDERLTNARHCDGQLYPERDDEFNMYNVRDNIAWLNFRGGTKEVKIGNGQGNYGLGKLHANIEAPTINAKSILQYHSNVPVNKYGYYSVTDVTNTKFKIGEYSIDLDDTLFTVELPYSLDDYDYEVEFVLYHNGDTGWVAMDLLKEDDTMVQGTCTNLTLRGEANGTNKAGSVSSYCIRNDNSATCWISDNTNNAVWGTIKFGKMAKNDTAVVAETSGNCCFGGSADNKTYRTSTIIWQGNDTNISASTKYIRFRNGNDGCGGKSNIVLYAIWRNK